MNTPHAVPLEGYGVRLEPLNESHAESLIAAAADGDLWKIWYVSVADVQPGRVHKYIDAAIAGLQNGSMVPWVVRELSTGEIVGSTRYHDIVPEIRRVEIGYTFYAQRWQRTHVNAACKLLLLEHAFDTLGCSIVGFRVDGLNERSQKAVESMGAVKEGVLRRFRMRPDGSVRDIVFYSVLAEEWSAVRTRLRARVRQRLQASSPQ